MSRQVLGKRARSGSFASFASSSSPSPSRSPTPTLKTRTRRAAAAASIVCDPPSPEPTPNPKRVKTCATEIVQDDDSNKENIPPAPLHGSLTPPASASSAPPHIIPHATTSPSPTAITPRAMRASRRASADAARSTAGRSGDDVELSEADSVIISPAPHRRVASSTRARAPASRRVSVSPPVASRRSATDTPSKNMARLSLLTPPPTPDSLARTLATPSTIADTPANPLHIQARALLRPQAHGATPLIGREQERVSFMEFLEPFLSDKVQPNDETSLYVSGTPGTGKTALVNEVLAAVSASSTSDTTDGDNASVRVVYVNCMALVAKAGLAGVWERCVEELGASKAKREISAKIDWSHRFSKLLQGKKCILVLDEIDHLSTSAATPASISQIFAIAAAPQTRAFLRIIGISNTHTLTHAGPSPGTRTMHFEPYTAAQMKAVVSARLAALPNGDPAAAKLLPAPTLALLTMKIASQTGDIRTVFSVARRSIDLAVAGSTSLSAITVTPAHVLAALKASNTSINGPQAKSGAETVTRARNLGLHARFALASLVLGTKRVVAGLSLSGSSSSASSGKLKENIYSSSGASPDSAVPSIEVTALHGFYAAILSRAADAAFRGVSRTEFADLMGLLEGSGLVELTQGRGVGLKSKGLMKGKGMQVVRIASGVREEELVRGLVGSGVTDGAEGVDVNVREEEVKRVWEREMGRMGREIKAKFGNTNAKKADFEGAEED